ncbi:MULTISPECIES: hypothetical protein [unclassified Wolbachia]|uniref:hypothetical protein n=2 Tax=unclassified Wolbachia TaxID=2640676 RepID=UPI00222F4C08|nr:hypothetical protein [Wolbachia endosymbiont (group A) of Apoderus coryli]
MRCTKRIPTLLIIAVLIIMVLLSHYCSHLHEDVVHLKSDNKEFKKKPENSIESTILHREKEVYDHVFHPDN